MEFHIAGDHRCREFGIRGSTGTTAPDGLGDIMNLRGTLCLMQGGGQSTAYLFAIFVSDDVAFGRTSISTQDDSILEETTNNGSPGAGRLGKWDPAICEEVVSVWSWRDYSLR